MSTDLQPGSSFGEYVLDRHLGGGGFGEVWLAHDVAGRHVALKVMHGRYSSGEAARLRAEIEVLAAAASSRSAHIARVLGGGADPAPHVVMEYIEGTDLARQIDDRGSLPVSDVLDVAFALADALTVLQRAGIVHRDIKPGNVMIDIRGVIKLTDFGIAKIIGIDTVTATGQASMSMPYAAPEVWEGKASHLSDHYAFGVLLFQCLTGRPPFTGNYAEIYRQHAQIAPDLDSLPTETPPSLRTLIADCLAKDPAQRPQSGRSLQNAVAAAKSEFMAPDETRINATLEEPQRIGPWIIESRSGDPWVFNCRHETSGEQTAIEVHFSDELADGMRLREAHPGRTSRFILRPGEGWQGAPDKEFAFWVARGVSPAAEATAMVPAQQVRPSEFAEGSPLDRESSTGQRAAVASPPPPAPPPGRGTTGSSKRGPLLIGSIAALAIIAAIAFALGVFNGGSKQDDSLAAGAGDAVPTPAATQASNTTATPVAATPNVSASPQGAANSGGPPGRASIDGPPVTANVAVGGETAKLTFTAAANQSISVTVSKVSAALAKSCAYISVVDPNSTSFGKTLICTENGFMDQVTLSVPGTYTLVWEPLEKATGQATFSLHNVTDTTGAISVDGAPVTANLSSPGQNAHYTFEAKADQAVSVLLTKLSTSLAKACGYVSIKDRLNAEYGKTLVCSDPGFMDQVTLSSAGSYTLNFDPLEVGTGQVTLALQGVVDIAGSISVDGAAVTANITTPGQNASYGFEGKSGQVVQIVASKTAASMAKACAYVSVVNGLKTELAKQLVCGDTTTDKVTLPAAGSYTLVLNPLELGTGPITLALVTAK